MIGPLSRFSLDGSRAVVTGGGRGIGRSIAVGLATAGASVAVISRSSDELSETVAIIRSSGASATAVPLDLARIPALDVIDEAEAATGGAVDIVVHAAGVQHRDPAATFPREAWDRVLHVDLTVPFLLSQELGRRQLVREMTGSHVFVASLATTIGLPNIVAYNAAKAGLMGVVRALSTEWAARGVRVNALAPGYVETAMTRELFDDVERRRRLLSRIPMERFGTPEDLVAPTIFLASDAASYVTGQMLGVNGGWTAA